MLPWLSRVVDVREEEVAALVWSCTYFFFVLSSYYLLRPMRETMGVAGGVENLPWLFTGTLVGMVLVHPLFAAAVARWPRRRFVPLTYRFFAVNLLIFFAAFRLWPDASLWIGRGFFVWISVYNLFVVSVFWSFMTDSYDEGQGKRLFGFIGLGGTFGAIVGSSVPAFLAERIGPLNLLLIAGLCLEAAVYAVRRLSRASATFGGEPEAPPVEAGRDGAEGELPDPPARASRRSGARAGADADTAGELDEEVIGGGFLDGVTHAVSSPYLLGIAAYMFLFTLSSTILYFQQAEIVGAAFTDNASRTAVFGRIDFAVNVLTILTQAFLTGRILRWLGVGVTLALLPAVSVIGFGWLGAAPVLVVVVVFQVLRRAGEYAVAKPTREVLYTVLPRTDKYKAKNFIDTFVYRLGDQVSAWSYRGLMALGFSLSAIAFVVVPVAGLWLVVALALGRAQRAKAGSGA